jgi:SAM-dependent methyltransferase
MGARAAGQAGTAREESDPGIHRLIDRCRACGGGSLRRFLELGPSPLANSFLRSPAEFSGEEFFPLDVYFCEDCSLVQLLDVIAPQVLFRDYIYVSGTSRTMARHNEAYARDVVDRLDLSSDDLVIEIASNDGSLLRCFASRGVGVLGIEPARNIAAMARAASIETLEEFFSLGVAREVRADRGPASVVVANNVLAHVNETRDFLLGCRELLGPDGRIIVEVPYVGSLLANLEYDTVYHEHLCYFSVNALIRLYEGADLAIEHIEHVPVHGGSIRIWAARAEDLESHGRQVRELAEAEDREGLTGFERYRAFGQAVDENRAALRALLQKLWSDGHTVAGYGAPAKGNTLLNYCGIGSDWLPYTVDKNPLKVGLLTPGMHVPVRPVATLLEERPDYVFILAWNFADEIMGQESEYRSRGGRFIVPIPTPRVIDE